MTCPASESQQDLVEVSSRSSRYRIKTSLERRLFISLLVVFFVCLVLIFTVVTLSILYQDAAERGERECKICVSTECIDAISNIMQSVDRSVDPCDDFYKFACGNWKRQHPIADTDLSNDWFSERKVHVEREIREFLEQNSTGNEPMPVIDARTMYRTCMNTDALESAGLAYVYETLSLVGLPMEPPLSEEETSPNFDWIRTVALAKKYLAMDLMIGFGITSDPKNNTINIIGFGGPSQTLPLPSYREVEEVQRKHKRNFNAKNVIETRLDYMASVMEVIAEDLEMKDFDKEKSTKASYRVLQLQGKLYTAYEYYLSSKEEDQESQYSYLFLDNFQDYTDNATELGNTRFDWKKYLDVIFEGVDVTLDYDTEIMLVESGDYYWTLQWYIADVSPATIESYLWWQVVEMLIPHTNRRMRDLRNRYVEAVTGQVPKSRSIFCTNVVNEIMGMAVSYVYVDEERQFAQTKEKVESMLRDIIEAFGDLVHGLNWMDPKTKAATLEKANAMKTHVAYPEWFLEEGKLEEYYEGMVINETYYLVTMLDYLELAMLESLENLRGNTSVDSWATVPTDVNAFHTFQANVITIPAAIIQFPFYGLGLESLNYGAIGTILGHELTHGFDDAGRQYDKDGNLRQWWSNKTVEEYKNRTECFVNQYNGYIIPEIDTAVDGSLTLGENIADNGGLREAFRAYKKFRRKHGDEPKLPGLEEFTHEQLFFLSFSNLWCEHSTPLVMENDLMDEHSPNMVRVWGSLSNSPEFAKAWKCPVGKFMNPQKKCQIW